MRLATEDDHEQAWSSTLDSVRCTKSTWVDLDDAVRAYRAIFDKLEPTNEAAISALGRIYEQSEAYSELNTVYVRELDNAVGDVQEAEIRAKMAHLAAERLGNVEGAIDGWKRVLDLRGEDPRRSGRWRVCTSGRASGPSSLTCSNATSTSPRSDEDRVTVLTRRARLFSEQLNRDDEALETWQRVLDIDFSNVAALRATAQRSGVPAKSRTSW